MSPTQRSVFLQISPNPARNLLSWAVMKIDPVQMDPTSRDLCYARMIRYGEIRRPRSCDGAGRMGLKRVCDPCSY